MTLRFKKTTRAAIMAGVCLAVATACGPNNTTTETADLSTTTAAGDTYPSYETESGEDALAAVIAAAESFDRQLTTMSSFGFDGDPSSINPRNTNLLLDMLRAPVDPSFDVENVPDSGTLTADLRASDLRVLVWNHDNTGSGADNWTRLCFGNVASYDCDANASSLQGSDNGDLPLYDDPYIETPTQLCFAFHKNGATAYLGVSDIANKKGVVDSDLATACAEATALVPVAPTKDYHNLGGGVANDQTWAEND